MLERRVLLPHPVDLGLTLGPLRHGPLDPSVQIGGSEAWRATRTPDGPATTQLTHDGEAIDVRAWGPGAAWAIERAPDLLGCHDDDRDFVARHDVLHEAHRSFPGLRVGRSQAVVEAMVASIIEQKITSAEAHRSYARLLAAHGDLAPGPIELVVPPAPDLLASLPYWAYHRCGIERRRAETIRRVCARAERLERCVAVPSIEAQRVFRHFEGVGPWTAAEVAAVALGDPDAVSPGDAPPPSVGTWALAGERHGDDARMVELLEPYRGHRVRVVRLLELAGLQPPRRAPRAARRDITRI